MPYCNIYISHTFKVKYSKIKKTFLSPIDIQVLVDDIRNVVVLNTNKVVFFLPWKNKNQCHRGASANFEATRTPKDGVQVFSAEEEE